MKSLFSLLIVMSFAIVSFAQGNPQISQGFTSAAPCAGVPTVVEMNFDVSDDCETLFYTVKICNNNKNCVPDGTAILELEYAPFVFLNIPILYGSLTSGSCVVKSGAYTFQDNIIQTVTCSQVYINEEPVYNGPVVYGDCGQ